MTKIFKFKVEEGYTKCRSCPFNPHCTQNERLGNIPCGIYDLTTLELIEDEEES